jgi:uncharacterized protein with GYD domain
VPKYLLEVSYNPDGMKGVVKEGGTSRVTMVEKLASNMGGSIESFHFAFGKNDAYVICDMPTEVDAAAVAMTVNAAGAASVRTVALLTPDQIDEATQKTVEYRAPGK